MKLGLAARRWRRAIAVAVGFAAVFGAYAILSVHFRRVGLMAPDESYYTLAARLVYEGKLPYRDFAYTQMPLMPYINGFLLRFIGFGLDNHRLVSSIWGALGALALLLAVRQRLGRFEPAFLAVFAFTASPRWCFLQSMGVWCGVAGMLTNLALAAVLWRGRFWPRAVAFGLAGTLTVGCRLSGAPLVALFSLVLFIEASGLRQRLCLAGLFLGLGAVIIGPFAACDPDAFYFMNLGYHLESIETRTLWIKALQGWDVSPAAITVAAISLLAVPRLVAARRTTEIILLASGLVGLVLPLVPESAWGTYISSSVPVAAVAGVVALWTTDLAPSTPHRHVAWLFPIMSLFHIMPLEVPEGAAREVEEIGAFIRNEVPPGPVLTPATIVAVEAGRDVVPGTEMGHFAAWFPWDSARAARYHMTTLPDLARAVEEQVPAAIVLVIEPLGWRVWNFQWAMPAKDAQPELYTKEFEDKVETCYRSVWRTSAMEVFVRRAKGI